MTKAQLKFEIPNFPLARLQVAPKKTLVSLAHSLNIKLFGTAFHLMVGAVTNNDVRAEL
jgi:hypothetical protein